jgi:SAM-dependent methyltransferase
VNRPVYDHGRDIDWGRTAGDYSRWRPGYPDSFFERLRAHRVFRPGTRVADLGTGTGLLARALAERGCLVTGVDVSGEQVKAARRLAEEQGLDVRWKVAPGEDTRLPAARWNLVTAAQSFLYFDKERAIPEVKRLLAPGGLFMICHMCWLPRQDAVAAATEELILAYNPDWGGADWSGDLPPQPGWAAGEFRLRLFFCYDEPIPFTRERWRGRIRACRGVGATLSPEGVAEFDSEHAELLRRIAPPRFSVLHRIDAYVMEPRQGIEQKEERDG